MQLVAQCLRPLPVFMAMWFHLFSFRTQKLSTYTPRIVGGRPPMKEGRCGFQKRRPPETEVFFKDYEGYDKFYFER